ncbi:MAG: hypothetical protein IJS14_14915 [Lentisphaeria bacterium]|nr:hypothetical protein [Lentisphaeria bacterium]
MKNFTCGELRYSFNENGFPAAIVLPAVLNDHDLLSEPCSLTLTLGDGRTLQPLASTGTECLTRKAGEAQIIEFNGLALADGAGNVEPGLSICLRYELYDDGTAFTDAFFLGETMPPQTLKGFELKMPLSMTAFETVRWALAYRPKKVDGTLIQTSAPERELPPGENRVFEHGIFPLAGFNMWSKEGPSCYAEFFMEADNVPAGNPADNESSVTWENGSPVLRWNFLTKEVRPACGPWQWRNRWGWVVAPALQTRRQPPLPMYHYFDNFDHYPTDDAVEAAAASGAQVLILHENWRIDVQNGGQPYDPARLRRVIELAHHLGMRVMLYIRGNEQSVVEEECEWFGHLLEYGRDGLYMDCGGPFHWRIPPNEVYQGGRICFRRHYFDNVARRRIVGPDGLFYSHTGPMFSALGMTCGRLDGYVSGEGERGLLVRSRLDHAYFSMASVCPGTMWTAAFPEYGEPRMVPFLAATGQSPHIPLGTQFPSSSLSHPSAPGINDVNFRPLWKLWNLMKGTKDLRILTDYNCSGMFARSEQVSHYLMSAGGRTVCIFANFTDAPLKVDPFIDFAAAGIRPGRQYLCLPTTETPGKAVPFDGGPFTLGPYGVGAVCAGEFDFAEYEKPYPQMPPESRKHLEKVEEQRQNRAGRGSAPEWWVRLSIPDLPISYEASMIIDLCDNRCELCEVTPDGPRKLGYLGRSGFREEMTPKEDFVMNGTQTVWIPLRKAVGGGRRKLLLRSMHRGERYYINSPFYSFYVLEIAREPDRPEYRIEFMNELESDRSELHFDLDFEE